MQEALHDHLLDFEDWLAARDSRSLQNRERTVNIERPPVRVEATEAEHAPPFRGRSLGITQHERLRLHRCGKLCVLRWRIQADIKNLDIELGKLFGTVTQRGKFSRSTRSEGFREPGDDDAFLAAAAKICMSDADCAGFNWWGGDNVIFKASNSVASASSATFYELNSAPTPSPSPDGTATRRLPTTARRQGPPQDRSNKSNFKEAPARAS